MVDTIHSKINYIIGHGKTKDAKMIPSQAGYGAGNGRREKNKRTTLGIPTCPNDQLLGVVPSN